MELELVHNLDTPADHADVDGLVPVSATLKLYGQTGTELQAPAVTLPTAASTTQAGTTALALLLGNAAGFLVGEPVAVVSDGATYVATVARIDSATLHLLAALPLVPDAGSPVSALTMRATFTAPGEVQLGDQLRAEWRYQTAAGVKRTVSVGVAVVRWPWTPPVSASLVGEVLAQAFTLKKSDTFCQQVSDRANDKIKLGVQQTGRRPWLYLTSATFTEVGQAALRWVLADLGIMAAGGDPAGQLRELRYAFADELGKVVAGLAAYDKDNTGHTDGARRPLWSIRTTR